MTTTGASALGARLDRLPLGPFHRRLVLALAGMILFEWVETYSFAFVAPVLRSQWGLSLPGVAAIVGISQLGAFTGGIAGGYLADRIGRRRTMLAFVTVYCSATALCIAVQNPLQLMVARFAAHLGAQGMAVVAIVVLTEFVPAAARGRLQTYKVAVGSLGIPIAAWAGYFLVPHWTWGWRLVFGLGLFGVVFAWLIRRWVPESPRWLASRGRTEQAEAVVREIERQCGVTSPETEVRIDGTGVGRGTGVGQGVDVGHGTETEHSTDTGHSTDAGHSTDTGHGAEVTARTVPRARIRHLLAGADRRTFLIVSTMWVTGLLAYSAYNTWTPTLLSENGLVLDDTLFLSAVLATAAPVGALFAVPVIDRWDRRTAQLVLGLLTAVTLVLFGLVRSQAAIVVLGCVASLLFQMAVPFLQVYSAEVFPTRIRALGSGTANALSRIFNFAAPTLVAALFAGLGYTAVFVFLAALSLVGGCVAVAFGPRTTGMSLEDATTPAHQSVTEKEKSSS
ncbi:MFS transporter [Streptomyces sp. NPDC007164]|uniref:MFS transporter n=1 Tax=Streptomyces sp. NPDC007164 TaxID=3156918 RepID=UPI0033C7D553